MHVKILLILEKQIIVVEIAVLKVTTPTSKVKGFHYGGFRV